jgi:hypothetical protein
MEVYRERSWIGDDPKISKRTPYDRHRILPSKLVAEYCEDETSTIARIWALYHELESLEPDTNPSPITYDDSALRWVASHSKMLYGLYPEQWILVGDKPVIAGSDNRVVASSDNPNELFPIANAQGIDAPFITRVVRPTKRKTMIYAK